MCTIVASYIVEIAEQQSVGQKGRDNSIKKFSIHHHPTYLSTSGAVLATPTGHCTNSKWYTVDGII